MRDRFVEGFLAGLLAAVLFSALVVALYFSEDDSFWLEYITPIAIPLTLLGVLLTIREQRKSDDAYRRQELEASRALLPLVLSDLIGVTKNAFAISRGQLTPNPQTVAEVRAKLAISREDLLILRDCIRYTAKGDREWIVFLLQSYQVYLARSGSLLIPPGSELIANLFDEPSRQDACIDWLILRTVSEHMLDFARFQELHINDRINPNRIRTSIVFELGSVSIEFILRLIDSDSRAGVSRIAFG